ncbi:MAG: hypothetical protein A2600_11595 [Candidatus Lambdaproteobacteria bacterium RIFOXYD1_FULL_56_27]|uniref:histidine kinase n=1 Tax=Candidatus Lambdaproteobacteria bacterium RIFOXYD2_FULL_56_26 TaxID=1817773 RepID=A0A1F6GYX1_9PROT|nr:MAG: hypothetical protein A2426_06225 [Candidatus Lambdaproteobacteria bacterium RIFOXYC1_FULL_56_13]OGH03241.1 MAG: hypothetical protein A2557_00770 [Candidatus Lambdaproteobacteria bacterium RIFOXYD2_FULL_56_26]OGH08178.1 MAG: hypothetical protein A2600_11595 [Candidatus Lambdaproteobacteria bacterium RIFOXYD1_FULL_56_27]
MKLFSRIFLTGILALWLGWGPSCRAATVLLAENTDLVDLGWSAEVWPDPTGQATLSQAQSETTPYRPLHQRYVNRIEEGVYWYRVRIHRQPDDLRSWVLKVGLLTMPTQVYLVPLGPTGEPQAPQEVPLWRPEPKYRHYQFQLDSAPDWWLYVRTQSLHWDINWLRLTTGTKHLQIHSSELVFQSFYYGSILVMAAFNLLLFFSTKDRIYLYYVASLFSYMGFQALAIDYLPLGWGELGVERLNIYTPYAYISAVPVSLFFTRLTQKMLDSKALMPRVHRWMNGLLVYAVLLLLIFPWANVQVLFLTVSPLGFLLPILSLWAGVTAWRRGHRSAKFYLVAFIFYQFGLTLFTLGFLDFHPFGLDFYQVSVNLKVASMLEIVLLAFALGDRYNGIKAETIASQKQVIELGHKYALDLEAEVAERTHDLALANQTKDKFFSIIAHDLRGPVGSLSVIFNEVLGSGQDLDTELFETVRTSIRNTHQLLEDLLSWAKSQQQEIEIHPQDILVGQVVTPCLELFTGPASLKGIRLVQDDPLDAVVFADPSLITTVVRNLINNAIKFTFEDGTIHLGYRVLGDRVEVYVADNGVGMNAEVAAKLFKVGEKAQSTPGTRSESGSGLGLILCAEFLAKSGGQIGVESSPGQGSRFWFTLPKGQAQPAGPDLESPAWLAKVAGLKVLVVEDNPLHQESTGKVLKDLNVQFEVADNGQTAVWRAVAAPFDLILMDIDLPQLNGLEATWQIRNQAKPAPWILALSSYSKTELARLTAAELFEGSLNKPLSKTQFLSLLVPLLEQRAAKEGAAERV